DPLLLDELELAGDAGVEGHEDDSAVGGVELGWIGSCVFGDVRAVGQAAAGDAAAIDEAAFKAEGIARVDTADVGSEAAAAGGRVEGAVGHEGAVAGEDMGDGCGGQLAGLVGIAEEELAGGEGLPGAVGHKLALAGLGLAADAEVVGVAEAIGVAEVLL